MLEKSTKIIPVAESIIFVHDRMLVIVLQEKTSDWLSTHDRFEKLMKETIEDIAYKAV